MTSVIDGVRIGVTSKGKKEEAKRTKTALLRFFEANAWGNQDGSLWVFEHDGLPVAMIELWARGKSHRWGHTMLAISSDGLTGKAANNRWKPASGSGVVFKPVPKAKKPISNTNLRKAQMRQLARRFKADNGEPPKASDAVNFRLLTEPIHRYRGGDVEDGAIFAFVRGETNPEAPSSCRVAMKNGSLASCDVPATNSWPISTRARSGG